MATYWAAVSRAPATDPEAQAIVIAALSKAPQVSGADAAHLSCVDVAATMLWPKSGTSPGHGGLAPDAYRRSKQILLPLLARFFQATTRDVLLPPSFHDGIIIIIISLPKPGEADASSPTGLRSSIRLNTDYRLFARIIASRLGRALAPIIDSTRQPSSLIVASAKA